MGNRVCGGGTCLPWVGFPKGLRTLCGLHCLLHGAAFVRDLAAERAVRLPLGGRQAQVAAGPILVVALFGWNAGLHALSDGGAICLPGHRHGAGVEVVNETHQCGLFGFSDLLRGGWEQND